MKTVDGKALRDQLLEKLKKEILEKSLSPKLEIILVGDNPSSLAYINQKIKAAENIDAQAELIQFANSVAPNQVMEKIKELNQDPSVTGIIVQLPLHKNFDDFSLTQAVDPKKDVDGLNEDSNFRPATPLAVLTILEANNVKIADKTAIIFGRSKLVGAPLKAMLEEKGASVLQINSQTPKEEVQTLSPKADILVAAVGKPGLITADLVKQGAVVIDVGITKNPETGKLEGDVDFENVKNKASLITPVPGGVGPLTVAMLLTNLVKAALK